MDLLNKRFPELSGLPCHTVRARASELPLVEAAIEKFRLRDEIADARARYGDENVVVVSLIRQTGNGLMEYRHHYDADTESEIQVVNFLYVDDGHNICPTYESNIDTIYQNIHIVVE